PQRCLAEDQIVGRELVLPHGRQMRHAAQIDVEVSRPDDDEHNFGEIPQRNRRTGCAVPGTSALPAGDPTYYKPRIRETQKMRRSGATLMSHPREARVTRLPETRRSLLRRRAMPS